MYPNLTKIITGPKYRNGFLFLLILIPNFIAAILEGASFALILGALSILSKTPIPSFGAYFEWIGFSAHTPFTTFIILAVVCQAIRSTVSALALYANSIYSLRIQEVAQIQIYEKIFSLSYRFVSQYKIGDLADYTKIPASITHPIMENANRFLISALMVLATLTMMFALNVKLALLTVCLLLLTGLVHVSIIKKIGFYSEKLSDSIVDCSKHTLQILQSLRLIHTFNRQRYSYQKIKSILNQVMNVTKKVNFWNHFIPSINELLGIFFVTAVLLSGIWILKGEPGGGIPTLIIFIALTHRLAIRIQMGNTSLGMILTHKGALTRVEEFLSDEGKEFAPKSGVPFHGLKNEIQLQDIELQHSKDLKAALKHLTVSIPKGATVAFVGASGAGKSTLLDVLLGLYAPTKGEIKVDGFNLKSFTTGSWRDRLGVVSQDSSVFNDTIEENILFGLENKSKEEIVEAAELAGLREFIETLPDKYDTIVGERGYRLSGGQRQRLALARALIRQPEILILDEATSNLDSHSEFLIQTALEKLHSKQTILIVAHRLSTIVHADRIYLLHEGSIAEEGTHTELLEKNGSYAKFWQRQMHNQEQFT